MVEERLTSVSYTHLDVYKRQVVPLNDNRGMSQRCVSFTAITRPIIHTIITGDRILYQSIRLSEKLLSYQTVRLQIITLLLLFLFSLPNTVFLMLLVVTK